MQSPHDSAGLQRVEAARYALLRRLSEAMRQQMLTHVHPIAQLSAAMAQRLRHPGPDLARFGRDMGQVHALARGGVDASLDYVSWLAPEPGATTGLHSGVAECLALLGRDLARRGFTLDNAVPPDAPEVGRSGLRMLLSALLFALTDGAAPGPLAVRAAADASEVRLALELGPATGCTPDPGDGDYRALAWPEVQALARSEGVVLEHAQRAAALRWPAP